MLSDMESTTNKTAAKISRCLQEEQTEALSIVFAAQDDLQGHAILRQS